MVLVSEPYAYRHGLAAGDPLRLFSGKGWRDYRVVDSAVIDAREARLAADPGRPALTLVTCYPFEAVEPGGPLRYLVFAEVETAEERDRRPGPKRVVSTMPSTMKGTPTR